MPLLGTVFMADIASRSPCSSAYVSSSFVTAKTSQQARLATQPTFGSSATAVPAAHGIARAESSPCASQELGLGTEDVDLSTYMCVWPVAVDASCGLPSREPVGVAVASRRGRDSATRCRAGRRCRAGARDVSPRGGSGRSRSRLAEGSGLGVAASLPRTPLTRFLSPLEAAELCVSSRDGRRDLRPMS